MIGSDVAINYLEGHLGYTKDYNITGAYPCTNILGNFHGVCPDTKVGGVDNFQVNIFERVDSLTRIVFRRNLLNAGDEGDIILDRDAKHFIVWAIGKLNSQKEPGFHHIYPKSSQFIVFGRKSERNCFLFNTPKPAVKELKTDPTATNAGATAVQFETSSLVTKPWGPLRLNNRSLTTLYARLGDSGGLRGYVGSNGKASPSLVWYINGLLAPVLYAKRGRTYTFLVEGGSNPAIGGLYNPLYITTDPDGGYAEQTINERKKYQIYAGIEYDRKGRPSPTSAGRLCAWRLPNTTQDEAFDKRRSDTGRYANFVQYRNHLNFHCENGNAALLQWTPNASTPDIVYYQSYTHRNMGNKIIVLDEFAAASLISQLNSPSSSNSSTMLMFNFILFTLALFVLHST